MTAMALIWLAITSVVCGLAAYRKLVARNEDDILHVRDSEAGKIAQQSAMAIRLNQVDNWGKTLTVVAFVSGVILAGAVLYQQWLVNR
jgi:hypothetical protein